VGVKVGKDFRCQIKKQLYVSEQAWRLKKSLNKISNITESTLKARAIRQIA